MKHSQIDDIKSLLARALTSLDEVGEQPSLAFGALRDMEIALRRIRNSYFPANYFSDAAWDILLDIDYAERHGLSYSVTDLGVDAGIPLTTTLRYLNKLERDGFVERRADRNDKRRAIVVLTGNGRQALDQVFATLARTTALGGSARLVPAEQAVG